MWVVISEKEWVVKTELENELEESWEGELKLEIVVSNNKSYKVYIVQSSCEWWGGQYFSNPLNFQDQENFVQLFLFFLYKMLQVLNGSV